jgi:transposase
MSAPVRLYGPAEVARMLDVRPSAVSNWLRRGSGPLPEPGYVSGAGPLWSGAQLATVLADRAAELHRLAEEVRA